MMAPQAVSIAGTAAEHQTLTAVVGVDPDGAGSTPTLQWLRNGAGDRGCNVWSLHVGHGRRRSQYLRCRYPIPTGRASQKLPRAPSLRLLQRPTTVRSPVSISGSAIEGQPLTAFGRFRSGRR